MLKFDNNNIFTGYLKQLLSSFNLPKYKVYTPENSRVHNKLTKAYNTETEDPRIISSVLVEAREYPEHFYRVKYIKDGLIQEYINGSWVSTGNTYYYNKKELNYTKNLKIKNNIYDYYTHEYLGDYLRFQRDYNNLDLMSLYNCFSNRLCNNLNFSFNIANGNEHPSIIKFNSKNSDYKIYMLPVKLFKKYTIAIDSGSGAEICCGFYDKYFDSRDKLKTILADTYKNYTNLQFNKPVLYDKLCIGNLTMDNVKAAEYSQNESSLKMFIKLPADCDSSITILEGDYLGYNDGIYVKKGNTWEYRKNKFITNYEVRTEGESAVGSSTRKIYTNPEVNEREFKPISKLQLLEMNTGVSYPFADRLIEYLLGNVITHLDELGDNVKRVQAVMNNNGITFEHAGIWEPKMRNIIYDYLTNSNYTKALASKVDHDVLGYVDKDAEKLYSSWVLQYFLDKSGNKVQATDATGTPIFEDAIEDLLDSNEDLLVDYFDSPLQVAEPGSTVPVYRKKAVMTSSIQNIDIYDDIYQYTKNTK